MEVGGALGPVLAHVAAHATQRDEALLQSLRALCPGLHFSLCSDDEMSGRVQPAAGNAACRLYYVASGDHCLRLTRDADAATGLLVARISPDE